MAKSPYLPRATIASVDAVLASSPWMAKAYLLCAVHAANKPWKTTYPAIADMLAFASGGRMVRIDTATAQRACTTLADLGIIIVDAVPGGIAGATAGVTISFIPAKLKRHMKPTECNGEATVKPRPRNVLWDSLCAAFALKPETPNEQSRIGKVVRDLKLKNATPDDIPLRLARYRRAWPEAADTPEALLKHWDRFGGNGSAGSAIVHTDMSEEYAK